MSPLFNICGIFMGLEKDIYLVGVTFEIKCPKNEKSLKPYV